MATSLSKHAVSAIFHERTMHPSFASPVVQVINIKRLPSQGGGAEGSGPPDRYRLILSDGEHFCQGMLATQMNAQINDGFLVKHSIVRLNKCVNNLVQGRKIVIVLDLDVLNKDVAEKIGDPQNVETSPIPDNVVSGNGSGNGASNYSHEQQQAKPAAPGPGKMNANGVAGEFRAGPQSFYQQQAPSAAYLNDDSGGSSSNNNSNGHVTPIASLNPYSNRWQIKARVSSKSDVKHYTNGRGDGKLFNVTFVDESGEIRATAFNDQVDVFEPLFEAGKVYYVSKMQIKPARKQWSSLAHDYELYFEHGTEIEAATDNTAAIPTVRYAFVPIASLKEKELNSHVDVIGAIKDVAEVASITTKSTQRQLSKRDVTIVDSTNATVKLTLWGATAERFEGAPGSILAAKGVRVGDFGGVSLGTVGSSSTEVDPDIPEAFALKGWFQQNLKSIMDGTDLVTLSTSGGGGGGGGNPLTEERKTLQQAKDENMGANAGPDKSDFFTTRASISYVKSENVWYTACPSEGCSKKVIEEGANQWRCEKCNKTHSFCDYRYMLNLGLSDSTGNQWVTAFNDSAQVILGQSAGDLNNLKSNGNDEAYNQVFQEAMYKEYVFRIRAKQEFYQDEQKMRCSIAGFSKLDFKVESQRLLNLINMY